MAQRFDLSQVAAEAATTLATLDVQSGDFDTAIVALERVVATAQGERDTSGEMRGRYHLAHIHLEHGRLAEAQELFRLAAVAATEAGRPWAPYGFDARYHQAMTALLRGRWDEALEIADFAGQAPPTDAEALLLTVKMLVAAGRGDDSVLRHYHQLKGSWPREGMVATNSGAAAIDLLGARGDLPGVWRVHDEVVAAMSEVWSPMFQARIRLSTLVLGHLAGAVEQLSGPERTTSRDRADELVDAIDAVSRRTSARPRGFGPEGRAWVARGRAEHLRLCWLVGADVDVEELVSAWSRAVGLFDELGHLHEAARSRARLAVVLSRVGRTAEASTVAAEARRDAGVLGATPVLRELGSVAAPRSGPRPSGALTPREEEILRLVALGRSNGEVGRQLFISTKTVSVHVSNILAKLGAAGRTEAVALARRQGLLDE
jgi:DNA-binding CsgD family transcriptional regulator